MYDFCAADSWPGAHGSLMEEAMSLSYRLCVAKTDYRPSPDMPQTALPIVSNAVPNIPVLSYL